MALVLLSLAAVVGVAIGWRNGMLDRRPANGMTPSACSEPTCFPRGCEWSRGKRKTDDHRVPAREHRRRREGTKADGGRGIGLAQRDSRGVGRQAAATYWRYLIPPITKSCCDCRGSRSNAPGPISCRPIWTWKSPSWPFASSRRGRCRETNQDFEGKIFLARSELERAVDRLNWSRRMNEKGYIPAAVVTSDQFQERSSDASP